MEARKARSDCAKAFWRFASRLLDKDEVSASPAFCVDDAESFFKEVYSCNAKSFSRPEWLPVPSIPHTPFNDDAISIEEIRQVIKQTKSNSTPSPLDQISYTVLKRCPALTLALVDLYNTCWSSGMVPTAWKKGVIRLTSKGLSSREPSEPRTYSTHILCWQGLHNCAQKQVALLHALKRLYGQEHPESLYQWDPWVFQTSSQTGNSHPRGS